MPYVYRFLNSEGKIIYIGKTVNIKNRMQQHFSKGHLPAECYRNVARIEYKKYNLLLEDSARFQIFDLAYRAYTLE